LGVPAVIEERKFGTDWLSVARRKPAFIREMLDRLKGPVLWLDCDCDVLRAPDFKVDGEWGVCLRGDGSPHSFVHYVPNSERSRRIIELWLSKLDSSPYLGDHSAFQSIIGKISYGVIPRGYFSLGLSKTPSKLEHLNRMKRPPARRA
jgi:hypothetical protein